MNQKWVHSKDAPEELLEECMTLVTKIYFEIKQSMHRNANPMVQINALIKCLSFLIADTSPEKRFDETVDSITEMMKMNIRIYYEKIQEAAENEGNE